MIADSAPARWQVCQAAEVVDSMGGAFSVAFSVPAAPRSVVTQSACLWAAGIVWSTVRPAVRAVVRVSVPASGHASVHSPSLSESPSQAGQVSARAGRVLTSSPVTGAGGLRRVT